VTVEELKNVNRRKKRRASFDIDLRFVVVVDTSYGDLLFAFS